MNLQINSLPVKFNIPVTVTFSRSAVGTNVQVDVTGTYGAEPRNYHLHSGKCGNNPSHWDPYHAKSASTAYNCNPNAKFACELGDLAGKFGQLSADPSDNTYVDPTLNFDTLIDFKSSLSLVVHYPNSTKQLDCSNLSEA